MEAKKVIKSINKAINGCYGLDFDEVIIDKREESETPEGSTKYTRILVDEFGCFVAFEITYSKDPEKINIDFTRLSGKVVWKVSTVELLEELNDHYIECFVERFFKRTGY